jgi:hypothetical protein
VSDVDIDALLAAAEPPSVKDPAVKDPAVKDKVDG